MVILALVLGGFGAVICYRVQASMAAAIDHDLAEHAKRLASGHARFLRWRMAEHEHHDKHDGDKARSSMAPPHDGPDRLPFLVGGQPGAAREPATPTRPEDADTERIATLRRPRIIILRGQRPARFTPDKPWDTRLLQLADAGQERYSTINVGAEHLRVFSMPLRQEGLRGKIIGVIQLAHELNMYDHLQADQLRTLLTLVPLSLLVTGLGGLFLTNRALRPVREVTHAAAEIGAHDLARRLEINGHDELAELASTFNGMIARLHQSFQNQQGAYAQLEAAYEQQRRFTADASHELRTPLARIKGSTSLALVGEWSPDEYQQALAVADDAADKMNRIIQDLLLLARSDAGQLLQPGRMDLAIVLEHAVAAVPNPAGTDVRLNTPAVPLEIVGDADHLSQVFGNLLENALRHTPANGCILISAQPGDEGVTITVEDDGEGIPAQHIPHIFERFYRVDAARSRHNGGTGLGLAISQSIVHAHGGTIRIEPDQPRGTKVMVTLPYGDRAVYGPT